MEFGRAGDMYTVLGVHDNADDAIVRRAFIKQMLLTHPDKLPSLASTAERVVAMKNTHRILEARRLLHSSQQRAMYNADKKRRSCEESVITTMTDENTWDVWMRVVIEAFMRQHNIGSNNSSVKRLSDVLLTLLPSTIYDDDAIFKLGCLFGIAYNYGIVHMLRDICSQDRQLLFQALEVLSEQIS